MGREGVGREEVREKVGREDLFCWTSQPASQCRCKGSSVQSSKYPPHVGMYRTM